MMGIIIPIVCYAVIFQIPGVAQTSPARATLP